MVPIGFSDFSPIIETYIFLLSFKLFVTKGTKILKKCPSLNYISAFLYSSVVISGSSNSICLQFVSFLS